MMRSPEASWTLRCRSSHFIATTMSRLSCRLCEMPFSTLKVWWVSPVYQRRTSVTASRNEASARKSVHTPPFCVLVWYEGLVLAVRGEVSDALQTRMLEGGGCHVRKASKAFTTEVAFDSPKAPSSSPRSEKPFMVLLKTALTCERVKLLEGHLDKFLPAFPSSPQSLDNHR